MKKKSRALSTSDKTVTTNFEAKAADAAAASALTTLLADSSISETLKTQVQAAMTAADWSGESVITAAPTVKAVSAVQAPVTRDAPAQETTSKAPETSNAAVVGLRSAGAGVMLLAVAALV